MSGFNCLLIVFASTHHALRAEKALKDAGVEHSVINTPREFSAGCGISLRIDCGLAEAARKALDKAGVIYTGIEPYRSRWL